MLGIFGSSSASKLKNISVGSIVEAQHLITSQWKAGVIQELEGDGLFTVKFNDNGEIQQHVDQLKIRLVANESSKERVQKTRLGLFKSSSRDSERSASPAPLNKSKDPQPALVKRASVKIIEIEPEINKSLSRDGSPLQDIESEPVTQKEDIYAKKIIKRRQIDDIELAVLERVRQCNQSGATKLDISRLDLATIPEICHDIRTVQELDCHKNKFVSLNDIASFSKLKKLDFSANFLGSKEDSDSNISIIEPFEVLSSLAFLRHLNISRNNLEMLPNQLHNNKSIETLIARNNLFTSVPDWLSTCSAISHLDLSFNRIEILPVCFEKMNSLYELALDGNACLNDFHSVDCSDRIRFLVEKRDLYKDKGTRRKLISRAIQVQNHVIELEKGKISSDMESGII